MRVASAREAETLALRGDGESRLVGSVMPLSLQEITLRTSAAQKLPIVSTARRAVRLGAADKVKVSALTSEPSSGRYVVQRIARWREVVGLSRTKSNTSQTCAGSNLANASEENSYNFVILSEIDDCAVGRRLPISA